MQIPKVSVIVPIYGVEKYIERCARSIFEQSYKNIECIFVNDCTKDNSMLILNNVLDQYQDVKDKVIIINHQKNKGLSSSRNTGIEAATGDYILHVDSDDFLSKDNVIENMVNTAIEEDSDMVVADYNLVYQDHINRIYQIIPSSKEQYIAEMLSKSISVCVWGTLFKTKLYKDNDIRHIDGVNLGEDYAVKPRLAYFANKVVHLKQPCYGYVQTNVGAITHSFNRKNTQDLNTVITVLSSFFLNKDNKDLYRESIYEAELKLKAQLLTLWCGSRYHEFDDYKEIASFPIHKKISASRLDTKSRLILCVQKYFGKYGLVIMYKCFHARYLFK